MSMRFRMQLLLWVATILFLTPVSAGAHECFVDAAAGNDDFGSGTAARPWRSFSKALQEVSGETVTVWVAPGTYRESISLPSNLKSICLVGPGSSHASIDVTDVPGKDAVLVLSKDQECWVEGLSLIGGGWEVPEKGETISSNGAAIQLIDCVVTYARFWNASSPEKTKPPVSHAKWLLETPKAIPQPGTFSGFNNQDRPMSLVVDETAPKLRSFSYYLQVSCEHGTLNTSVTTTWTTYEAPVLDSGAFDFTLTLAGADWRFTGSFQTPCSVAGEWYAPLEDSSCGPCSAQGTWYAVHELIQTDINQDEVVNASDIQLVIIEVLKDIPDTLADINGDGTVDALDIQIVVNTVLHSAAR